MADDFEEMTLEESVKADLMELPLKMRRGGVARAALTAARILDEGGLAPRDAAGYLREMRLALAQLRDMAPGEVKGDATDEVRERRERRLGLAENALWATGTCRRYPLLMQPAANATGTGKTTWLRTRGSTSAG